MLMENQGTNILEAIVRGSESVGIGWNSDRCVQADDAVIRLCTELDMCEVSTMTEENFLTEMEDLTKTLQSKERKLILKTLKKITYNIK